MVVRVFWIRVGSLVKLRNCMWGILCRYCFKCWRVWGRIWFEIWFCVGFIFYVFKLFFNFGLIYWGLGDLKEKMGEGINVGKIGIFCIMFGNLIYLNVFYV